MKNTVKQLKDIAGGIKVNGIRIPEHEDLNTFYLNYGREGVLKLIGDAEEVEQVAVTNIGTAHFISEEKETVEKISLDPSLEIIHPSKLLFKSTDNDYYILGGIPQDMGSLYVTLMAEEKSTGRKERTKIDLYEREQLRNLAIQMAEIFTQSPEQIEVDLLKLTDHLEQYRETLLEKARPKIQRNHAMVSPENQKKCVEFLTQPDLVKRIDKLIEQAGVVGEENSRKLLFVIASTYKMKNPLHALVQGTSGSGKSHLINCIGRCLPPEDVMSMTRVTSKSFYHYNKEELVDKLMLIQDFDGLDEEAQYAFRELQSAGTISSSTTYKDRSGNIISTMKIVRSHFASLLATTKAEVYYDTMSRSVIIGVDESELQTDKIIQYQNKKLAGIIDERDEQKASSFLQNCIRCIKPMEVINPYADKVNLPLEAKMLRRLNTHYQCFVKQITILHQYQRKKDEQGRLIAEPQDLQIACNILFDAIMLKVDDLDTSLRQFFDRLKEYVKKQGKEKPDFIFTQRDVRLALAVSKTQCFRYMEDLELLEYIQKTGGYANRGFKYKIVFWDDMEKIKHRIKERLGEQLNLLIVGGDSPLVHGSPASEERHATPQSKETALAVQYSKTIHSSGGESPLTNNSEPK